MNRSKVLLLALVISVSMVTMTMRIWAAQSTEESEITIRQVEPQTVLYTIHRGDYREIGKAIGDLYALAVKNKIWPSGALQFVYLNNPNYVSRKHWLTEIRIPVKEETVKLAGTLGEMTDVKKLPAMAVAFAIKPPGFADSESIKVRLDAWIFEHGYIADENPCEKFLSNAKTGDYTQMKSEIFIPVRKVTK